MVIRVNIWLMAVMSSSLRLLNDYPKLERYEDPSV